MHSPRRSPRRSSRRSSRGRGHINLYTGNTRVPKTYVGGALVEVCPFSPYDSQTKQTKSLLQCQSCQRTDKLYWFHQCGHVICISCARSQGSVVEECPYSPNYIQTKSLLQCKSCQRRDKLYFFQQCRHFICIPCARSQATLDEINHELIEILTNLLLYPTSNSIFNSFSDDQKLECIDKFRKLLDKKDFTFDLSNLDGTVWQWLRTEFH